MADKKFLDAMTKKFKEESSKKLQKKKLLPSIIWAVGLNLKEKLNL